MMNTACLPSIAVQYTKTLGGERNFVMVKKVILL